MKKEDFEINKLVRIHKWFPCNCYLWQVGNLSKLNSSMEVPGVCGICHQRHGALLHGLFVDTNNFYNVPIDWVEPLVV